MICTIKDKSFQFYNVNSSDLSELWCLKENEDAILRRTERVRVKTMCGQTIIDKRLKKDSIHCLHTEIDVN